MKDDDDHPTRETISWHPTDDKLRAAGFTIYARPRYGVPRWRRDGQIFKENEALRQLRRKASGGTPGKS